MSHHLLIRNNSVALIVDEKCQNAVLHTAKSVAVGHPGDFGIQHETFRAPKQTRCYIIKIL